jgi:hypothetical protein
MLGQVSRPAHAALEALTRRARPSEVSARAGPTSHRSGYPGSTTIGIVSIETAVYRLGSPAEFRDQEKPGMTISFWAHEPPPPAAYAEWDPDREPGRFATDVGHNVLELAKRLEALGASVRVGEDGIAPGSLLVLFLRDAYSSRPALRRTLRAVRQARGHFVVIRSDTPSDWSFPLRPVREFVPTRGSIREPWERWIPPLPQRGLRPRRRDRRGAIRTLALKGNKSNVPDVVRTREWADALASRGIRWWLDMSERRDGADQASHDFAEVDAVLCSPQR